MKWIGLTGGIATGKSAVSDFIRSRGFVVIDADQVAREVVAPGSVGLEKVLNRFGSKFLLPDGSLDRKKLGQVVFANPADLRYLENALHPLIQSRVKELKSDLIKNNVSLAFYDVPLLFEKEMESQFDGVVVVWCRPEQQIERLMARDGMDQASAELRIKAQIPILEKVKKSQWSIDNTGDQSALNAQIERTLDLIQKS